MVIMFTDMVDSSALKIQIGDQGYVEEIARPHNEMFRALLKKCSGTVERAYTGDGFMATFASVGDAVTCALRFHHALRTARWGRVTPKTRIGIHLGDTIEFEGKSSQETSLASHAADMTARVMSLGEGGQTLMTRAAFDSARQSVRSFTLTDDSPESELEWLAYGHYRFKGSEEPMEIFEVGVKDAAPLRAPGDSEKAKRVLSDDGALTLGWQAAVGKENPARAGLNAEEEHGEGASGDFIGRERQLSELDERLKKHPLVTLTGLGGMGKTRLALEIVKRKKGDAAHGAAISFVL